MAAPFVLDVNLRVRDILGLQKVEAALGKLSGAVQMGAAAAGGSSPFTQSTAANATAHANALNNVSKAQNQVAVSSTKATKGVKAGAAAQAAAANSADSFGKSVFLAGKRYAGFVAATAVPFAALAGISKAVSSVVEFDAAMLRVRQIMGETKEDTEGVRNSILEMATATGTSATEIARVGKVLSQAGFRGQQLEESLSALSKVPLTPTFENMDNAGFFRYYYDPHSNQPGCYKEI